MQFETPEFPKIQDFEVIIKGIVDSDEDGQPFIQAVQKIKIKVIVGEKYSETSYPALYQLVKAGESWDVPLTFKNDKKLRSRILQTSSLVPVNINLVKQVLIYKSGELSEKSVQFVPTD